MDEGAEDLDLPSDSDLTAVSAEWDSDEEVARMHILLLQANWAKPRRMRKVKMTARAKRKRFAQMIRRCRQTPQDEPRTCPHALKDSGAPTVEHELLDAVCPSLPPAPAY